MERYNNKDREPYSNQATLTPSFLRGPWDIVTVGRVIGSFVLGSAVVLAIWEVILFGGGDLPVSFYSFWRTFIDIGVWGVVIILLSELVDRVWVYRNKADREEVEQR
jgi:hypothetical protein